MRALVIILSIFILASVSIAEQLILVGDAGETTDAFMERVVLEARRDPKSTVIFLGDNIYPAGLPLDGDPKYPVAKERLMRQVSPLLKAGFPMFFVAGNHDWANTGENGLENVQHQERFLAQQVAPGTLKPRAGCPGPEVILSNERFFVVALDSMWFLHPHRRLEGTACGIDSPDYLRVSFAELMKTKLPGAQSVLVFHHPLIAHGDHSVNATCPNSAGCHVYQAFKTLLEQAIANASIQFDACVSGHEHVLEVVPGNSACKVQIISGAGSYPRPLRESVAHGFARGNTFGFVIMRSNAGDVAPQIKIIALDQDVPVVEAKIAELVERKNIVE